MAKARGFHAVNLMKIAIIGLGYIGNELAKMIYDKGHFITCASHYPDSLKNLTKTTHKSLILSPSDENEMLLLLNENDVIIVTISSKVTLDY